MIICDNDCSKDAVYTCADPGTNPINYCADCLPVWLQTRAAEGHFPLITPEESKPAPKKKKAAVVEEAASDENN